MQHSFKSFKELSKSFHKRKRIRCKKYFPGQLPTVRVYENPKRDDVSEEVAIIRGINFQRKMQKDEEVKSINRPPNMSIAQFNRMQEEKRFKISGDLMEKLIVNIHEKSVRQGGASFLPII